MAQSDNMEPNDIEKSRLVNADDIKGINEPTEADDDLVCGIDDVPPWYLCILLGFQQFLTMFGATLSIPFVLTSALCAQNDQSVLVYLISTITFVSGIATILQTTMGVRLPIVQGGTFSFLIPALSILSLPQWKCPGNLTTDLTNFTNSESDRYNTEVWQSRMREIQGAIMTASIFEVILGLTGVLGFVLRFVGPLTIAPTITMIGIALFEPAAYYAGKQWYIAILTMVLITLFSQYLSKVSYSAKMVKVVNGKEVTTVTKIPVFGLFPILLAMVVSWIICAILTKTGVLTNTPGDWGYDARTDTRNSLIWEAGWFRFPYPGQWGRPTVSVGATFGMVAGVLASMVESVGDYYACSKLCGTPPPPPHAINRGLFMEGIGSILAGAWGSGNATTSYSSNIGTIGLTKVASRRVIVICAGFMLLMGCIAKFNALVASMPEPVLGGALIIAFGMVVAVGLSNLDYVKISSSRNSFIIGTSFFVGLSFPYWMTKYGSIDTGNKEIDQILTILCSTSMFIGGLVGFVLDNTIPGTKEERGLLAWHGLSDAHSESMKVYDIPYFQEYINTSYLRYLPILPSHPPYTKDGADAQDIPL